MKKLAIFLTLCLLCAMVAGCSDDTRKYQEMLSRAQESFDHHMSVQQGGFSIPSDFSLPEGSVIMPPTDEFGQIEEIGTPGIDYPVEVMEMLLPAEGAAASHGWYVADGGKLRLYSRDGEVLWEQAYDAARGASVSAGEAGVAMVCGTTLSVYSPAGELVWEETMKKDSRTTQPFLAHMTDDGQVYVAVGFWQSSSDTMDIHVRRYNPDGTPDAEQVFSGQGNMAVYALTYHKEYGLAMAFCCYWEKGDLTQGKTGNFGIGLLGEDLSPLWINWQDGHYYRNLTLAQGRVYIGSYKKTLCLNAADGSTVACADGSLVAVREKVYLQAHGKESLAVCDKELKPLTQLPLTDGTAERVEETEDGGVLIMTKRITGQLPSTPETSALLYTYEWVFTRYDKDGEILYRVGYDDSRM